MYKFLSGLCLVAVVALSTAVLVRADDPDKISVDKLPKEVTDAINKKYPDAKLISAEKEKKDGKECFEVKIKFKDKDGAKEKSREVIVSAEGKILSVEKVVDVKDVPKVVLDAVEAKYPKSTVTGAEEITKDDKVTSYEVKITTEDKKHLEVTFDTKGKFVEEEKGTDAPKKDAAKDKKDPVKDK